MWQTGGVFGVMVGRFAVFVLCHWRRIRWKIDEHCGGCGNGVGRFSLACVKTCRHTEGAGEAVALIHFLC